METPLFFKNNNYNLFGVLHEPDQHASALDPAPCTLPPVFSPLPPAPCTLTPGISPLPPAPSTLSPVSSTLNPKPCSLGFVFCHPFAEEKIIAHRVMVNFARSITKAGISCLRFDYMGHGDSSGYFENSTVDTRLSDISCAIEFLKNRTNIENVGLFGVRLGATLALLASGPQALVKYLILFSPIITGKSYIDQCLRSNLTTQVAIYKKVIKDRNQLIEDLMSNQLVNIDGYLLSKSLYQQLEAINLGDKNLTSEQDALLIINETDRQQQNFAKMLAANTKVKTIEYNSMQTNRKELEFWSDKKYYYPHAANITNTVVEWLNSTYSKHSS